LPDDLGNPGHVAGVGVRLLPGGQADELSSFVGQKANKQWIWIALIYPDQSSAFLCPVIVAAPVPKLWDRFA